MDTTLNEGMHTGEFILSEASGTRSREAVLVTQAGTALPAGQVLGKYNAGASATSAAKTGNTGNGAMGAVTVTNAQAGRHVLRITAASANAGAFTVEDPDGQIIGTGNVAAAFSQGGLAFTLADGVTDFAVNDVIYIDVARVDKYKPYNPANTDGSGTAVAILYGNLPSKTGDAEAVAYVRDCEVDGNRLTSYGANAGAKAVTKLDLETVGIIVRV